jgi:hypothetical protein
MQIYYVAAFSFLAFWVLQQPILLSSRHVAVAAGPGSAIDSHPDTCDRPIDSYVGFVGVRARSFALCISHCPGCRRQQRGKREWRRHTVVHSQKLLGTETLPLLQGMQNLTEQFAAHTSKEATVVHAFLKKDPV